jgi:hypothetical protein
VQELAKKTQFEINLIRSNSSLGAEQAQELEQNLKKHLEEKVRAEEGKKTKEGRVLALKQKVRHLIAIFKTWKEYTNILALTSAQVIKNKSTVNSERVIQ